MKKCLKNRLLTKLLQKCKTQRNFLVKLNLTVFAVIKKKLTNKVGDSYEYDASRKYVKNECGHFLHFFNFDFDLIFILILIG